MVDRFKREFEIAETAEILLKTKGPENDYKVIPPHVNGRFCIGSKSLYQVFENGFRKGSLTEEKILSGDILARREE